MAGPKDPRNVFDTEQETQQFLNEVKNRVSSEWRPKLDFSNRRRDDMTDFNFPAHIIRNDKGDAPYITIALDDHRMPREAVGFLEGLTIPVNGKTYGLQVTGKRTKTADDTYNYTHKVIAFFEIVER